MLFLDIDAIPVNTKVESPVEVCLPGDLISGLHSFVSNIHRRQFFLRYKNGAIRKNGAAPPYHQTNTYVNESDPLSMAASLPTSGQISVSILR